VVAGPEDGQEDLDMDHLISITILPLRLRPVRESQAQPDTEHQERSRGRRTLARALRAPVVPATLDPELIAKDRGPVRRNP